jgi:hypothetical protein
MSVLVLSFLVAGTFGSAAAAPNTPDPSGRALGNAIEGEPGAWRVHFAALGVEDGDGKLWGGIVSDFAKTGMMGGHASGK